MNPGPAPRPPGTPTQQRLNYTPAINNIPGNMSAHSLNSAQSIQTSRSQPSLTDLTRKDSSHSGGALSVIKEGPALIKEEGVISGLMWSKKQLVLRERQLDFHKASNSTKLSFTIYLKDVLHITRTDLGTAFEITRLQNGAASRDGPTKTVTCKVDTDDEVYSWIDNIYDRCPNMGGVSNPTNFAHQVHVGFDQTTGAFVGLPPEWERLLTNSAISEDDYRKNPTAVIEVLNFYTEKMQGAGAVGGAAGGTPGGPTTDTKTTTIKPHYSAGTSIAPPRPPPPTNGLPRNNSFDPSVARDQSPAGTRKVSESPVSPLSATDYASERAEQDRKRREEDLRRERAERDRRERERHREDERRRREREEQAAYNASIPQTRQPIAKQEIGGGYANTRDEPDRYAPVRTAPQPPSLRDRNNQTPTGSLRQPPPQQQPVKPSSSPDGRPREPQKPFSQPQRQPSPGPPKQPQPNGSSSASTRIPVKPSQPGQASQPSEPRAPQTPGTGAQQPKPLNVTVKQPTGPAAVAEAAKNLEGGGANAKQDQRKEVRMSAMSEGEVMARLREVVSKEAPHASYIKQKKIGQGASGSVYVARVKESPASKDARAVIQQQGPRAQVAIKQMDLKNQPRKELIVNEIVVMKDSKHLNIVNFIEAFLPEDQTELWVVMEFMEGGPLTDVIDNNQSISEDQIATICLEVCSVFCFHYCG